MTNIRVASFNASLNRSAAGDLAANLSDGTDSQAQAVAEVIQRTDADVILINEFDFDANGDAARLFQENYLSVSQNGQGPIEYAHVYVAPSNTGVPTGLDLDNDGATDGPGDAQGFGFFEGQFGFIILSKYEIDTDNIRTFQEFLWKDMPGNFLTEDPTDGLDNLNQFYTAEEAEVLRLSSKNHVDVPVIVDGETVHILAAHPTPPVFDGSEDRNGKRNHDEIRFWSDYVDGEDYIYDDNGQTAWLAAGDALRDRRRLQCRPVRRRQRAGRGPATAGQPEHSRLGNRCHSITPTSEGGPTAATNQAGANETHTGNPAFDTADFGFAGFTDGVPEPRQRARATFGSTMRCPRAMGLAYLDGNVFWQAPG